MGTVASVVLPPLLDGGYELVDAGGKVEPVQQDSTGRSWFVVRDLGRRSERQYRLRTVRIPAPAVVKAIADKETVRLEAVGKPVMTYRMQPTALPPERPDLTPVYRRGGYIHPVLSPSGRVVTDDYPRNHRHHHGIWFAWSQAVFEGRKADTWNMGDGKGTVEFVELDATWSGPVHAGFLSRHRQVDLSGGEPRSALEENWELRLYSPVPRAEGEPVWVFDLEVTDRCAGMAAFDLPRYRYGGIGVRGNWAWNGTNTMAFLNSEGVTDRSRGDNAATVGRWAYLGGPLDDGWAGIAVMDHPGNAFAPQPQRIHPTEPFLCLAPQQAGSIRIEPGRPLRLKYRFVVADGRPDAALMERLWGDFAEPPTVRVAP